MIFSGGPIGDQHAKVDADEAVTPSECNGMYHILSKFLSIEIESYLYMFKVLLEDLLRRRTPATIEIGWLVIGHRGCEPQRAWPRKLCLRILFFSQRLQVDQIASFQCFDQSITIFFHGWHRNCGFTLQGDHAGQQT